MPSIAPDDNPFDDPRVSEDFLRTVPGENDRNEVVIVGVVHDHPASIYRVGAVTRRVDPDVVALELPQLAVPGFERLARDHEPPPPDEMSAAIAAAEDARAVGIDTLGLPFLRRFLERAREERVAPSTLRRAGSAALGVVRHATVCRFSGPGRARDRTTSPSVGDDAEREPGAQADDERTQVARSRALLGATERPRAERLVDDVRERTMAAQLAKLRRNGTVVAVVGIDHVDAVTDRLREASR